jgi:acyl-CoA synthetase (NDP forming)
VDQPAAARAIETARSRRSGDDPAWLAPAEVRALLAAYGIAMPESVMATSADETAEAAWRIGFPVAIKLVSHTITHKSDVGGVVLDVRDGEGARLAWALIAERLRTAGREGEMQGVLVQPMAEGGVETIVGMTRDPSFGPLLMFGLGGIQAELLKDVIFRLPPLTDRDAAEMVAGIRGARLLEGYRGAPASDRTALEELLLRVSQLVGEQTELVEMDLNPVLVRPAGRGCLVLDARIAVGG